MNLESTLKPKKKSLFRSLLNEIIEFKGWEILFKLLLLAFVSWGVYVLSIVYIFHTSPEYNHIPKFHLSDFKEALAYLPLFFLFKLFMEWACTNPLKTLLDPAKFPTDEDRSERAKKASKWIMSIIYYSASTISCYYLFKDLFFFPPMLGGSGSCSGLFMYQPEAPPIPNGQRFYMVQFACHLHTLLDHIAFKRGDSKFWEMFLHHGMSVFLILFSYMSNEIAVGILVLFVHDPGDIFLDAVRFYNDLKSRKGIGIAALYVSFMGVWIYFRLYTFPTCIIAEAVKAVSAKEGTGIVIEPSYWYLIAMLMALFLLHVYWFFMILKIAVNIVTKKKEYNSYDNSKKVVKKNG